MFQIDADEFQIILPNGYTLTFIPCDENRKEHFLQPDYDESSPKPFPCLRMIVTGNGTNVRHVVMDVGELWRQIKSFAEHGTDFVTSEG
ncbi:MAG: hypothetical protein ACYSW8_33195 [Planctomycetota bacterium]|jgi:hypothetical protein